MIRQLWKGIRDYGPAHKVMWRDGMWRIMLAPGLLSLFYFPVAIALVFMGMDDVAAYIHDHWVPDALQSGFTRFILIILLWILGGYLGVLLYRNVIMILYAPFLGYLSESADRKRHGQEPPPFQWKTAAYYAWRGVSVSLLTLLLAVLGVVVCWLFLLIPLVGGLISIFGMLFLQVYCAGVGFADPALERRDLSIGRSVNFTWKHRYRYAGNGLAFVILVTIPVIGWFLAPSYGIIAGTISTEELADRSM